MTVEIPKPRYQKGEIVRVVDEPYEDCPFEWIGAMDDCCGHEARIVDVSWIGRFGAYGYSIDIDECDCIWCENCFVVEPDLQESEFNPSILFQ